MKRQNVTRAQAVTEQGGGLVSVLARQAFGLKDRSEKGVAADQKLIRSTNLHEITQIRLVRFVWIGAVSYDFVDRYDLFSILVALSELKQITFASTRPSRTGLLSAGPSDLRTQAGSSAKSAKGISTRYVLDQPKLLVRPPLRSPAGQFAKSRVRLGRSFILAVAAETVYCCSGGSK